MAVTSARDHLAGRPGRIAVFCPPHLVPKWGREIQILMPDSQVHCPKTPADVVAAMSLPPTGPEFWIFSRDRLKRQWYWRWGARPASSAAQARWAATHPRSLPLQWVCPDCGAPLATPHARPRSVEWVPWNQPDHRSPSVAVCPTCSAPLWQANRDGPRQLTWPDQWRRAPASVTFDLLLADEVHEEKGQSFQSQVLADLMRRSHRHAFLTGTILGGMARDVFYHLWRSDPRAMQAAGYQYNQPQQFARDYGRVETHLDGANRVRRRVERPGIHPALFGDWLLERTIFLDLADLHAALPSYTERVELVTMDPAQAECVTAAYAAMRDALQDHRAPDGSIRLGSYVQNALTYPDRTGSAAPLTLPGGDAWVPPAPTAPDRLLPKTARIIQLCLAQKAQGRRVLVFLEYPNLFQVDGLIRELEEFDLRVAHLTPKVPTAQRETWLRDHLADVLICQPRLMGTGLDAIEYPTIIWAQTGYSLLTVQQASRRSYRIGQTQPVNVIFLAYEGTLQARALTLLSEKAQAAAAISGHFDEHSLRLWAPADSMAMQLAEALALGMTLRAEHAAAQNPAPTPEPTAWPARPTKAPRRRADSPHQLHFGFDCARVH